MGVKADLDAAKGSYPRAAVWKLVQRDEAGTITGEGNSARGMILEVDDTSFHVRPECGTDYSQAIVDVLAVVFVHK